MDRSEIIKLDIVELQQLTLRDIISEYDVDMSLLLFISDIIKNYINCNIDVIFDDGSISEKTSIHNLLGILRLISIDKCQEYTRYRYNDGVTIKDRGIA
jgi:hypothetical protein